MFLAMADLKQVVSELESNTSKLLQQYRVSRTENAQLKSEVAALRQELNDTKDDIRQLSEGNKVKKLAGVVKDVDNKDIKLRINELVREIDKCIAQLNR